MCFEQVYNRNPSVFVWCETTSLNLANLYAYAAAVAAAATAADVVAAKETDRGQFSYSPHQSGT